LSSVSTRPTWAMADKSRFTCGFGAPA